MFKDLLEKRKGTKDIAISPLIPDGHNIDQVLRLWASAGVIQSFDTTKSGFYVVFINDGDKTISKEDKEDLRKYLNTCTRINVENPRALALCKLPTIPNLRRIARRTHIVGRAGQLVKIPSRHNNRHHNRYRPFVAQNTDADKEDQSASDRLREFLKNNGLVDNNARD